MPFTVSFSLSVRLFRAPYASKVSSQDTVLWNLIFKREKILVFTYLFLYKHVAHCRKHISFKLLK